MCNPKISVIVPVYKAEAYLHRCVDSLLAQTFTDFEVLLVDDGSPDRSGEICDEYARKDRRVRVFHKENGGVSSARNCGMDNANGEWIMFVDSDDWLEDDCLTVCMDKMYKKNLDIVQFEYKRVYGGGNFQYNVNLGTDVLNIDKYAKIGKFLVCVGGSLLKKSIIEKYSMRFVPEMRLAEDQLFMIEYMCHCQRLMSIHYVGYNYFYNPLSASLLPKTKDVLFSIEKVNDCINKYPPFANHLKQTVTNAFLGILLSQHQLPFKVFRLYYDKYMYEEAYSKTTPLCLKLYKGLCIFFSRKMSYFIVSKIIDINNFKRKCYKMYKSKIGL